jgi:glycosyltransferase involved in cell wall biosynthesis
MPPRYPGVGRYVLGLLSGLAPLLGPELVALHGPEPPTRALAGGPAPGRLALGHDLRSLASQVCDPLRLARRIPRGQALLHAPFYVFPYLAPYPVVATLHDVIPLERPEGHPRRVRLGYRVAHRLAIRRARALITGSDAARRDLAAHFGIPPERITVVPHGCRADAPAGDGPAPGKPGRDEPEPYVLFVGADRPHKNLSRLVEAMARLGPTGPRLMVAGPADDRGPGARRVAERLGLGDRARFLGWVSETRLAELYAGAVVVACPSLAEGFGFPVLEALAAGAPLAAADLPAHRELAGDAAAYFEPRSVEAMAATLAMLLADPVRRADQAARGRARAARFTWVASAEATLRVYRAVPGR